MTRDSQSSRAQLLAGLPNVVLIEGRQDNQLDLHRAFQGVYGAWVNTDGFSLNEKEELFYGIRTYEIARHERVQHFIWASLSYTLKNGNWDTKYHAAHADSKGRVRDFILAQGQGDMKSSILTTVPYMEMLVDGVFVPQKQPDGSFVWLNPASKSLNHPFLAENTHFLIQRLAKFLLSRLTTLVITAYGFLIISQSRRGRT